MRLWIKLGIVVTIAAAIQYGAERCIQTMDEVAFTVRVGCAVLNGEPQPSRELMDAAARLREREQARYIQRHRRLAGPGGD